MAHWLNVQAHRLIFRRIAAINGAMWVTWRKLAHQFVTGGRIGSFKELLSLGNSAFASVIYDLMAHHRLVYSCR
ncbi:Uncharacterized protein HZ326_15237 [Fusarium oxysporum f. sp. albedinis]|nr:Uncharacterized protein HZ326_15237 [Fusarium oxysporum f. sp. albedinis]